MGSSAPEILFAPDSGREVGGGHVMRCLSLGAALTERGAKCTFVVSETGAGIIQRLAPFALVGVVVEKFDRVLQVAAEGDWAAAILDSYRVSAEQEAALAREVGVLAVIDDLARYRHSADILLDPGFGRSAADYAHLLKPEALGLFGPDFALLRPEFSRFAAKLRVIAPEVKTVFVSFGLSDVGGVTARALEQLMRVRPELRFELAVSGQAQSLPRLQAIA